MSKVYIRTESYMDSVRLHDVERLSYKRFNQKSKFDGKFLCLTSKDVEILDKDSIERVAEAVAQVFISAKYFEIDYWKAYIGVALAGKFIWDQRELDVFNWQMRKRKYGILKEGKLVDSFAQIANEVIKYQASLN